MKHLFTVTVGVVSKDGEWSRSADIGPSETEYKQAIAQLANEVELAVFGVKLGIWE